MFQYLSGIFSNRPRRAVRPSHGGSLFRQPFSFKPRVDARYDAAVTNDDNRRHWSSADGLSAKTANGASIRRTLRNRARYEIANNSYARGISLTLANDIVGTGPPVITPSQNEQEFIRNFAFRTVAPLPRRWGIVQGPCPAGEIGRVCIAGATACRLVVSNAMPPVNFVSVDSGVLVPSYASGDASVLWREGGTGEQWAIIRIGQVATTHHLFTLTEDMSTGTGVADIHDMDDSVTIEQGVEVLDPLGIFESLEAGVRGICVLQLGKYYIIQAECI